MDFSDFCLGSVLFSIAENPHPIAYHQHFAKLKIGLTEIVTDSSKMSGRSQLKCSAVSGDGY